MKRFMLFILSILIVQIQLFTNKAEADWDADLIWQITCDIGGGKLKFSNTDKYIVVSGCRFYDVVDGHEVARLECTRFYFNAHFIENDAKFIRVDGGRQKIYIWDANTFKIIDSLESIENEGVLYNDSFLSRDERYIFCAIEKDSLTPGFRVWDVSTKKIIATKFLEAWPTPGPDYELKSFQTSGVGWTCDGNILTYAFEYYWHWIQGRPYKEGSSKRVMYSINLDSLGLHDIKGMLSPSCKYLITYVDGSIPPYIQSLKIFDYITRELVWDVPISGPGIDNFELDPSEKFIVTAGEPLTIWSIEKKQKVWEYSRGSKTWMSISHNGKYIVNDSPTIELFKAHFDDTLSIKQDKELPIQKTIYPNPTTGLFTLKFDQPNSEITAIAIRDIQGSIVKTLFNEYLEEGTQSLNFSVGDLSSGVYFITVLNSNLTLTFKLIIIK